MKIPDFNEAMLNNEKININYDQFDNNIYDEILKELVISRMIERGLKDSHAKKRISHEEMEQRIKNW